MAVDVVSTDIIKRHLYRKFLSRSSLFSDVKHLKEFAQPAIAVDTLTKVMYDIFLTLTSV